MSHYFNSNSSPYTKKISFHNRLSKNDFFEYLLKIYAKTNVSWSNALAKSAFFKLKSSTFLKKIDLTPLEHLTIFGLLQIEASNTCQINHDKEWYF